MLIGCRNRQHRPESKLGIGQKVGILLTANKLGWEVNISLFLFFSCPEIGAVDGNSVHQQFALYYLTILGEMSLLLHAEKKR